jgi:HEPN domain-containing protein
MADNFRAHFEVLVHKADVDLAAVEHLTGASGIDKELLLFHLQQAVEKYLKALLSFSGLHFEKTHDIIELLDLCRSSSIALPDYANEFEELYPYAVQGRYDTVSDAETDPSPFLAKAKAFQLYVHQYIGVSAMKDEADRPQ